MTCIALEYAGGQGLQVSCFHSFIWWPFPHASLMHGLHPCIAHVCEAFEHVYLYDRNVLAHIRIFISMICAACMHASLMCAWSTRISLPMRSLCAHIAKFRTWHFVCLPVLSAARHSRVAHVHGVFRMFYLFSGQPLCTRMHRPCA